MAFRLLPQFGVLAITLFITSGHAAPPTTAPAETKHTYRLQRIEIPPSSKLRDIAFDDHSPPDLYITITRDGDPIGKSSEWKEGWDVEYSATKANNRYVIDPANDPSFSISIYDYDTADADDLVLTISGLTASDFHQPIKERLSPNDPPDRAVVIYFKPID